MVECVNHKVLNCKFKKLSEFCVIHMTFSLEGLIVMNWIYSADS